MNFPPSLSWVPQAALASHLGVSTPLALQSPAECPGPLFGSKQCPPLKFKLNPVSPPPACLSSALGALPPPHPPACPGQAIRSLRLPESLVVLLGLSAVAGLFPCRQHESRQACLGAGRERGTYDLGIPSPNLNLPCSKDDLTSLTPALESLLFSDSARRGEMGKEQKSCAMERSVNSGQQ